MKKLASFLFLIFALNIYARDPGTGSNTTTGPGPVTPDAGSRDTGVMGGGTPGGQGPGNLDLNEPDEERLKKMKQKQEEKSKIENNTDQNPELDTN